MFNKEKQGLESKIYEVIMKKFPWRTKESLKNFWKTIKNKKLSLESALQNEYKDSAYCFNSVLKIEPHKFLMAERRVERFVKKISKPENLDSVEEEKGSVKSRSRLGSEAKSFQSIQSVSEAGKLDFDEIVQAIDESQ